MQPTISYCEAATSGLIKRPFYFLSNFAYIFLAFWFFSKKNKLALFFGYVTLLVGVASALYDLTFLYVFQLIDLTMMMVFIAFLIMQNLHPQDKDRSLYILSLLVFVSMVIIYFFKGVSGDLIFALFVVFYITQTLKRYNTKEALMSRWGLSLTIFLSGFIFWMFDYKRVYCVSFGLLNGRSIFHFTTAIATWLLYEFYLSKAETNQK